MFIKGKIYLVEWIDMRSDNNWHSLEDTKIALDDKFDSIGRFIEEYKGYYIFECGRWYGNRDDIDDLFSTFSLPKGQLLKSSELKIMTNSTKKKMLKQAERNAKSKKRIKK